MAIGDEHYPADVVGYDRELAGAGILAWLTEDQLHPPMLPLENMWSDGSRWAAGAREYVIELGCSAGLKDGQRVLDVGCGVCGPARLLVDEFGVNVTAITNSRTHAETSLAINSRNAIHASKIEVIYVGSFSDWPAGPYDVAWSMDMLYQVPDHQELYGEIFDRLVNKGLFVIDDWMAVDDLSEADLSTFKYHFAFRNLIRLSSVEHKLAQVGFLPATEIIDRGEAARGPMKRHFVRVMNEYFSPLVGERWSDPGGMDGAAMCKDFSEAIEYTIKLYTEGKLTYRSLLARKLAN